MPVTTTVQDILSAAYGRSAKNSTRSLASEGTELTKLVGRSLRGLFAVAARVNPTFFAATEDITLAAGSWARPESAESVFRIEVDGDECAVVPYDDREAETGMPAVYRWGQKYFSAGNALDPVAGDLTFFYARRPDLPATQVSLLDAQWVESYNDLLVQEVAIYLALKDNRGEEIAQLTADRDRWLNLFLAFLEHETANERRRFGHVRFVATETLVPIKAMLAGGGA